MPRRQRGSQEAYAFVQPEYNPPIRHSARLNPRLVPGVRGSIRSCDQSLHGGAAESLIRKGDETFRKHARISRNLKRTSENLNLPNSKRRRVTFTRLPPYTQPLDRQRKHSSTTTLKAEQHFAVHADDTSNESHGRKRKQSCKEPQRKRLKTCATPQTAGVADADIVDGSEPEDQTTTDPVSYWASEHHWPNNFATMSQARSNSLKKRPPSSSYSQSYRDGDVPKAHSRAYGDLLAEKGLHIDESKGKKLVNQESKSLCGRLLQASYPDPAHTPYPLPKFADVWQRAQSHNEDRLFRDITPLLIPSPELLYICGHQELEHVAETLNAEWKKVKVLCGPNPKPDQVIGLTQSAFNDEQVAKLKNHTCFERPTLFGENVYFPFMLVEAKCGEEAINHADRQNMHSSSIALNAILELYLGLDDGRNRAAAFNGEILVFSISHDNERVKLFGHFAIVDKDKISFYRYYFEEFVLNLEERQGRKKTHDFVRAVYDVFYPTHLARICNALAEMRDPRNVSMASNMSVDETDSEELVPSALSSQETAQFKKPNMPAGKKRKGEMDLLREQLVEQQKQSREQLDLLREQLAEQQKQREEAEEGRKELTQMIRKLLKE